LSETSKQSFFQGWAQLWREQMSADVATRMAATSAHAPGMWRANGPLVNEPAFGEAFGCTAAAGGKTGKGKAKPAPLPPMQLKPEQQVSIWR